ncbi:MAG: hypothetical protein ACRDOX_08405, partial [Nocardioides sp.]
MWIHLSGRLGAKVKEAACKSPMEQLSDEARKPGSHAWPVKDAKRRQRLQDRLGADLDSRDRAARARQTS